MIKYISVHGFPRKSTGETDWIRLCSASNFSQKDPQGMESTCIDIMEEAERVLINPPDARVRIEAEWVDRRLSLVMKRQVVSMSFDRMRMGIEGKYQTC